jgi:hypothetical protein
MSDAKKKLTDRIVELDRSQRNTLVDQIRRKLEKEGYEIAVELDDSNRTD